jgi:polyisoprenoid-binding protein YceI
MLKDYQRPGGEMTVAMLAVFSAVLQQADTLPRTAAAFEVDPEESVFAVITHKAGFASRFAHNHFIAAGRFEARLEFTPEALEDTTFELEVNATDLVVDDPELREALASRLGALSFTD